jgi:hypothetical protein
VPLLGGALRQSRSCKHSLRVVVARLMASPQARPQTRACIPTHSLRGDLPRQQPRQCGPAMHPGRGGQRQAAQCVGRYHISASHRAWLRSLLPHQCVTEPGCRPVRTSRHSLRSPQQRRPRHGRKSSPSPLYASNWQCRPRRPNKSGPARSVTRACQLHHQAIRNSSTASAMYMGCGSWPP